MFVGDDWVIFHIENRSRGNTGAAREWLKRIQEEKPVIKIVCDKCGFVEIADMAESADRHRMDLLFKRALVHGTRFGMYQCPACMRKVAGKSRQRTMATPEWKAAHPKLPSWQSKAAPEKLEQWREKSQRLRAETMSKMTPEERSRGVRNQWASLSDEAKAARAAKIGVWGKKYWAAMTEEARNERVRNMIKGLPRSKVSNQFRDALQKAGLYEGFKSEEVVSGFSVDECDLHRKLIIEFHGDYYHCNPRIFTDPNWVNTTLKMTAEEKWRYDRRRLAAFLKKGYRVLVVWESDWVSDPNKVLERVHLFLENIK